MKDTNTTVTGIFFIFFFFHLESKFASRCFEERCSKTEVSSAKGQQYQSYRNILFFIRSQNLHPVVLNKGAPKQRFLQRKSYRNIFLFHLKPIFVSLFFKRRCPERRRTPVLTDLFITTVGSRMWDNMMNRV